MGEGSIIIEVNNELHESMINAGKINVRWKRCPVFNHIDIKRCYKCWGYYHIAKNCVKNESCHKCAGNHAPQECTETRKKCVNCAYKIRTFNLNIDDGHSALSPECPTYKRIRREEERRTGWVKTK